MTSARAPFPPQPAVGHVTVMRASQPDFVGVFVEGPGDVSMWRRWLRWPPLAAEGKAGVLAALGRVAKAGIPGCVGIVDADLDRVAGTLPSSGDVVVTEGHDLECDLVRSRALDALLSTTVDDASIARLLGGAGSLRDGLAARALPFGLLRWVFVDHGVEFPGGRLGPRTFVDPRTWQVREGDLLDQAAIVLGVARTALDADLAARRPRVTDPWQVCNGHDVVALLAIALRGPLGAPKTLHGSESVSLALRLAFDSAHLAALAVWRDLGDWEAGALPRAALSSAAGSWRRGQRRAATAGRR